MEVVEIPLSEYIGLYMNWVSYASSIYRYTSRPAAAVCASVIYRNYGSAEGTEK